MNRLPFAFQPSFSTGIFHLEATLIISITVLAWLFMYTNLLSLVALLTYFPFLYIWILPAQGLNCHFWEVSVDLILPQSSTESNCFFFKGSRAGGYTFP